MKTYRIDVNIVDDHVMFVEGLTELINHSGTAHISRTFTALDACRQTLRDRRPDVLLLDISMPDGDTLEFCRELLANYPRMRIIILSYHSEYTVIQRMLKCGVHGYVLKDASVEVLLEAIQRVYQGENYVTSDVDDILKRGRSTEVSISEVEKSILRLLCEGRTNPEIASELYLSTETVNWYRKRLLSKFNAKNTVCLVTYVMKEKLI